MSRNQKITLIVLAFVDILVIGAMGWVMVSNMSGKTSFTLLPATVTATASPTNIPTWTPTVTATPSPTLPPAITRTPRPTRTPYPTLTPSPLPTPAPVTLVNPEFDQFMPNQIPGWQWDADVNYQMGDEYNPQSSYAQPTFKLADDPRRQINGSTLQIETVRWLKFRAYVYQQVTVTTGIAVYFRIKATAYSSIDQLILRAGVDPQGGAGCENARWSETLIDQEDGIVTITSPRLVVGRNGRVTVCLFAEPRYPDVSNAAFFDQAELIVAQPRP